LRRRDEAASVLAEERQNAMYAARTAREEEEETAKRYLAEMEDSRKRHAQGLDEMKSRYAAQMDTQQRELAERHARERKALRIDVAEWKQRHETAADAHAEALTVAAAAKQRALAEERERMRNEHVAEIDLASRQHQTMLLRLEASSHQSKQQHEAKIKEEAEVHARATVSRSEMHEAEMRRLADTHTSRLASTEHELRSRHAAELEAIKTKLEIAHDTKVHRLESAARRQGEERERIHAKSLAGAQARLERRTDELEDARKTLRALHVSHAAQMDKWKRQSSAQLNSRAGVHADAIEGLKSEHSSNIARLQARHEAIVRSMREDHEKEMKLARAQALLGSTGAVLSSPDFGGSAGTSVSLARAMLGELTANHRRAERDARTAADAVRRLEAQLDRISSEASHADPEIDRLKARLKNASDAASEAESAADEARGIMEAERTASRKATVARRCREEAEQRLKVWESARGIRSNQMVARLAKQHVEAQQSSLAAAARHARNVADAYQSLSAADALQRSKKLAADARETSYRAKLRPHDASAQRAATDAANAAHHAAMVAHAEREAAVRAEEAKTAAEESLSQHARWIEALTSSGSGAGSLEAKQDRSRENFQQAQRMADFSDVEAERSRVLAERSKATIALFTERRIRSPPNLDDADSKSDEVAPIDGGHVPPGAETVSFSPIFVDEEILPSLSGTLSTTTDPPPPPTITTLEGAMELTRSDALDERAAIKDANVEQFLDTISLSPRKALRNAQQNKATGVSVSTEDQVPP
jgi:hypothetical protein